MDRWDGELVRSAEPGSKLAKAGMGIFPLFIFPSSRGAKIGAERLMSDDSANTGVGCLPDASFGVMESRDGAGRRRCDLHLRLPVRHGDGDGDHGDGILGRKTY